MASVSSKKNTAFNFNYCIITMNSNSFVEPTIDTSKESNRSDLLIEKMALVAVAFGLRCFLYFPQTFH